VDENHAAGQTIGSTGFRRIRHYGLFASSNRTKTMEAVRKLLNLAPPADEPDRSSAAARPPLLLLRRPHDHHRDLRGLLPATTGQLASRGNQDRYLMSVDTFSHTTARFPRWSSTGNAAARPDACPALHLRSRASPKPSISTAHPNPISRSSAHNHKILAP